MNPYKWQKKNAYRVPYFKEKNVHRRHFYIFPFIFRLFSRNVKCKYSFKLRYDLNDIYTVGNTQNVRIQKVSIHFFFITIENILPPFDSHCKYV